MISDVKTALSRTSLSILGDFAGAAALVLIMVVGLNLPVIL